MPTVYRLHRPIRARSAAWPCSPCSLFFATGRVIHTKLMMPSWRQSGSAWGSCYVRHTTLISVLPSRLLSAHEN